MVVHFQLGQCLVELSLQFRRIILIRSCYQTLCNSSIGEHCGVLRYFQTHDRLMFQIDLLFLLLLCHVVELCRDVTSTAGPLQVLAVSVDPWLEGRVLVLHVLAEGFATCLAEFADMARVCVL